MLTALITVGSLLLLENIIFIAYLISKKRRKLKEKDISEELRCAFNKMLQSANHVDNLIHKMEYK